MLYLKTDRALFSRKIHISPKLGKKGSKWPPNKVFWILWKIQNIVIDISPPISFLKRFWFSSYGSKCCWPINLQDFLKCNIPRKKLMMKFIFGMQIDREAFYKFILWFWVFIFIYTQSIQIRNLHIFAMSPGKHRERSWFFACQINTNIFYKLIVSF